MTSRAEDEAGLFGKLSTRADFVRVNVTDAALEFATYLENAVNVCRRAGCEVPAAGCFFLYRAPAAVTALTGILRASGDKVGRTFPLAIFARIDAAAAAAYFDLLPLVFAPFFEAAQALARDAAALEPAVLAERVAGLPLPTSDEYTAAQERGDALLAETTIAGLTQALFGSLAEGRQHFAFHTLASGCEQSREIVGDGKPGITLDLPLMHASHPVIWLGAVRRLLGEQSLPPSLAWTNPVSSPSHGSVKIEVPPSPGRLLVAFGAPPAALLAFLSGSLADSPKLWPASCKDAKAIERVKSALAPSQREALASADASIDAVVRAFGGS